MNDMTPEERIASKTDLTIAGATSISSEVGGIAFKDMGEVMEFSKLMAVSGQAIPTHLRNKAGACLAISLQALNWRMDPFAVANKSYMVNDRIAYEAQLIHAVVEQRAPIKGRIRGKVTGEGPTRKWILTINPKDDEPFEFEGQEFAKITTKNSPLWKSDPDQQLWYYTVRAMCRRHFPDVILGVYEKEELVDAPGMKDVTPGGFAQKAVAAREAAAETAPESDPAVPEAEVLPDEDLYASLDASAAFPGSPAWDRGVADAQDGKGIEDCPYDITLDDAADWVGGWRSAQ